MAIYWGDYRQNTGHFNCTEHGAYMMLMAHYWENDSLPKPGSDFYPRLYNICGCVSEVEKRAVRYVIKAMFPKVRGRHVNKRLDKEIEKAEKKAEERSKSGRMGGRPRESKSFPEKKQKLSRKKAKGNQSQSQSQSPSRVPDPRRGSGSMKPCPYCNRDIPTTRQACDSNACIQQYKKDFLQRDAAARKKKVEKAPPPRAK